MLWEEGPGHSLTLGAATLVLLVMALFACWLPARRAAAINPLVAIRYE